MSLLSSLRSLALVGAALLGLSRASQAATFTVTNTNNSGAGSLRQAILDANNAPSDDTINFAPELATPVNYLESELVITNHGKLTINGNAEGMSPIDGKGTTRLLTINSGADVTLNSLLLAHGQSDLGGAIANYGTLTIQRCSLRENTANSLEGGSGGALANIGGTISISDSSFTNNTAAAVMTQEGYRGGSGGAIVNRIGANTSGIASGTITIENSQFTGNTGYWGGAILNSSVMSIRNSTLERNTAREGRGGAINSALNLTIDQSTFIDNSADRGGAISVDEVAVVMLNNSTFARNTATTFGGAISNNTPNSHIPGLFYIDSCTFSLNSGSAGGAIFNSSNRPMRLNNNIVANNSAGIGPNILGTMTDGDFNLLDNNHDVTLAGSHNLIVPDARLGGLSYHGGPTLNFTLLPDSPALDAGDTFLESDGRGVPRPIDLPDVANPPGRLAGFDIGAVEMNELPQSGPDFVINSSNDGDDGVCGPTNCTLREAIDAAEAFPDANTINFDPRAFASKTTIALETPLPDIASQLNIVGPVAEGSGVTIYYAQSSGTVFKVTGGVASISNLTFNGPSVAFANQGGDLTINRCAISNSTLAIRNDSLGLGKDKLTITNSTLVASGAGLWNGPGTTATIDSSTFASNDNGIVIQGGTVNLTNSIVVDISGSNIYLVGGDLNGHHNITTGTTASVGLDPDGLKDNGGPTPTVALVAGSPAIDAGATSLTNDGRGKPRPVGSAPDIGAFEVQNRAPVVSGLTITPTAPLSTDSLTVTVEANDADGDQLTYSYVWRKGNTVIEGATGATLPASRTEDGDSITVTVTANDGQLDSAPFTSQPVVIGNHLPIIASLSPQGASDKVGNKRTFTVIVGDGNGARDIREVWLLINDRMGWESGATLIYRPSTTDPTQGTLTLRRGDAFLPAIPVGSGATSSAVLDNGAVRIAGSDVTVSISTDGKTLALNLPLTLRDGLVGANKLFALVSDSSGAHDPSALAGDNGFVRFGNYSVTPQFSTGTNVAPTVSRLQPGATNTFLNAAGIAPNPQTMLFSVSDADGMGDIESLLFIAGKGRGFANGAVFVYYPRDRRLYLRSDNGQSWLGGIQVGQPNSAGILENSQVRVDLSRVKVAIGGDGKSVAISLPMQAKAGLLGANKVWLRAQDKTGATAPNGDDQGYVLSGTWNVARGTAASPGAASGSNS